MNPLEHLAIIWAAVFVAVVAAKKTRLTPVLYFLFIGCVLANLGILPEESGPFIRNFAELGIIFIMFALGFEESTDNFMASVKRSWGIALFGALGPFVVAYAIADYIWQDPNISLMVALAMTATAVSLTMVSLSGSRTVEQHRCDAHHDVSPARRHRVAGRCRDRSTRCDRGR